MLSYWEYSTMVNFDLIIIGSGIVGLQTAIHHKKHKPQAAIAILERGILPTGASTKNAGFACFGSAGELLDDLNHTSEQEVLDLYQKRQNGIQLLLAQFGAEQIGYEQTGSLELLTQEELSVVDQLPYLNQLLGNTNSAAPFKQAHHLIKDQGINTATYTAAVQATQEGCLHTGKLMKSLIGQAQASGISIFTGAEVIAIEEDANKVIVFVKNNLGQEPISFLCSQLVVCTNAFTKNFFPEEDIQPGRGQVLITEPIEHLKLKGTYHIDKGYYYFRTIDNRVLLGGGRNLDFVGENTTSFDTNEPILAHLKTMLARDILPNHNFEVAHTWTGIMAFGQDKHPIVKQHSNRVYGAYRLGGMGVALGTQTAHDLVALLQK